MKFLSVVEAMAFLKMNPESPVPDIQLHFAPSSLTAKIASNWGMEYHETKYGFVVNSWKFLIK